MIEYDYTYIQNGEKLQSPFKEKSMANVSLLEARSGIGKSGFLNMLALALYGKDNLDLNKDVRHKINLLYNSELTDLNYKVKLTSEFSKYAIRSKVIHTTDESGRPRNKIELELSEDGGVSFNRITKEQFTNKFRLRYEIPNDPLNGLNKTLDSIRIEQNECKLKIDSFNIFVSKKLSDLEKSRDDIEIGEKEKKLREKLSEYNERSKRYEFLEKLIPKLYRLYVSTKIEVLHKEYIGAYNKYNEASRNQNKENKEYRAEKKKYDSSKKSLSNQFDVVLRKLESVRDTYAFIKKSNDEKKLFDAFGELIKTCNKSTFYIPSSNILDSLSAIDNFCKSAESACEPKDYEAFALVSSVLNILKSHSSLKITIFDKSIEELSNELSAMLGDLTNKTSVSASYQNLSEKISDATQKIKDFNKSKSSFDELKVPLEVFDESIDELYTDVDNSYNLLNNFIKEVSSLNIDESNYKDIIGEILLDPSVSKYNKCSVKELYDEHYKLCAEKKELDEKLYGAGGLKASISYLDEKLKELRSMPADPLKKYTKEIKALESKLSSMGTLLGLRNGIILKIIDLNNIDTKEEDTVEYLEQVWKYLGSVISYVPYLDGKKDVRKIDMISRQITTTDGIIIPLDFLSTGQSQNTYLRSILKDNDNKIIIALFDEVSNMDFELTQSLIDMCIDLYKEGKLLVGLFTRPSQSKDSGPKVLQYS